MVFPQPPRGLAVNDKRNLYFRLADCVWTATRKQFLFFPATYSLDQQIVTGLKDSPGLAIDSSDRVYLSNGESVYYALGRDRRVGIADTVDAVKDLTIKSEKGNIYICALVRSNNVDSVWQFPVEPKTFIE